MDVDNLIERLEAYRKGNRITKAEMSRIIGATSPPQYSNWVARKSLPKAFIDPALRILGNTGDFTKAQISLLEKIDGLSDQDRALVEQMVQSLLKAS